MTRGQGNKSNQNEDEDSLVKGPGAEENVPPRNAASQRCPSCLSIERHSVEYTSATPLGDDGFEPIYKRRTVFSLFDLDLPQAVRHDTELEDSTNKSATPRADTVSVPNARRTSLKQTIVDEAYDKPRNLSISRYLEEISKIGANGASQSTELPESIIAEPSPVMAVATGILSGCLKDTRATTSQQPDGTAFNEMISTTPSTSDHAAVWSQPKAYVTSQRRVENPSYAKTMATMAASSTLFGHDIDHKAEGNDSAAVHQEGPSRAKHATIVTGKPSITAKPVGVKPVKAKAVGNKAVGAKPKSKLLGKKAQGNRSLPKHKKAKAAVPTTPANAKAQSTAISPGFAGILQAAEKSAGCRLDLMQKKETADAGGGKRPDVAIAMELEKQKRAV